MYVEEACEALLGRVVTRCRRHHYLSGYDATLDLFVTTSVADRRPHGSHGLIRRDLVTLLVARLRSLVARRSAGVPFARLTGARTGVWEDAWPTAFRLPAGIPDTVDADRLTRVFRGALVLLTTRRVMDRQLDVLLQPLCTGIDDVEHQRLTYVTRILGRWKRERAALRRTAAGTGHGKRRATQPTQLTTATSSTDTQSEDESDDTDDVAVPDPPSGDSDDTSDSDELGSAGELDSDS